MNLVLFTSNLLGLEVARALTGVGEVRSLHVVTTRLRRPRTPLQRIRKTYRYGGPRALVEATLARLPVPLGRRAPTMAEEIAWRCPLAVHRHFSDLHSPECLAYVRSLDADLGVVFACYRLRRELYSIPRLGLQREVLVPAGAAMMAESVRLEARNEAVAVAQARTADRPRPRATWAQQRELRRVVAKRRAVDTARKSVIS